MVQTPQLDHANGENGIREIVNLYRDLLDAWNRRDAQAFAALFMDDGHAIRFDGSQMAGPPQVAVLKARA